MPDGDRRPVSDTDEFLPLDASDLDNYLGQPLPVHQLREPVAINDIRRWVQGMHYPNPLHFDPDYAADSRYGRIVRGHRASWPPPRSHTGVWPANIGKIANSALLFGGDEWWFFGPKIFPGEHIKCYPMPFDYKVANTSFAGPTCFQRGDTTYINTTGERVAIQRSTRSATMSRTRARSSPSTTPRIRTGARRNSPTSTPRSSPSSRASATSATASGRSRA